VARRFDHDSDKSMHLTHEDGIDTLGKSLLGLSLGCARCHDHKYDAITARDYYALLAARLLAKPEDGRLDELFRLALQRSATEKDRTLASAFLARYAAALTGVPEADRPKAVWAALCRVVLAGNEFLYVE
jgi:hypothetical protein